MKKWYLLIIGIIGISLFNDLIQAQPKKNGNNQGKAKVSQQNNKNNNGKKKNGNGAPKAKRPVAAEQEIPVEPIVVMPAESQMQEIQQVLQAGVSAFAKEHSTEIETYETIIIAAQNALNSSSVIKAFKTGFENSINAFMKEFVSGLKPDQKAELKNIFTFKKILVNKLAALVVNPADQTLQKELISLQMEAMQKLVLIDVAFEKVNKKLKVEKKPSLLEQMGHDLLVYVADILQTMINTWLGNGKEAIEPTPAEPTAVVETAESTKEVMPIPPAEMPAMPELLEMPAPPVETPIMSVAPETPAT